MEMDRGDYLVAGTFARQAIEAGGGADAYRTLGLCLERQGRRTEAHSAYRAALDLSPEDHDAMVGAARTR